jgi:hypothetical protein
MIPMQGGRPFFRLPRRDETPLFAAEKANFLELSRRLGAC